MVRMRKEREVRGGGGKSGLGPHVQGEVQEPQIAGVMVHMRDYRGTRRETHACTHTQGRMP